MSWGARSPAGGRARVAGRARTLAETWGPGLAAVAIAVVLLPLFSTIGVTAVSSQDVRLYRWYGEEIVGGAFPFRDMVIEYPPAAVALFVVPALLTSSYLSYAVVFAAVVGGFGMAGLVLAARIGTMVAPLSRTWFVRTIAAAVLVALLGSVALTRFDFVPAALTVAALYALLRQRLRWAGILLGAAVAVKLYPAVIVPVAAMYVFRRSGTRPALAFVGCVILVVVASYVPFLLVAPDGLYESQRVQVDRALQIESVGASLFWLAREAGLAAWPDQLAYYDLRWHGAEAVAVGSAIIGVAALGLIWWHHARGPADDLRLLRYSLGSIAAFVVFGKVLSPQYLLWLVLLVPALRGSRANAVTGLLAAAAVATAMYFPRLYETVVLQLDPYGLAVIVLRNLLLIAVLLAAVVGLGGTSGLAKQSHQPRR